MKKLLAILFVFIFVSATSSIVQNAHAQVQEGDFKAGAGLVFGSGIGGFGLDNDLGLRVDGYYAFTPEIRGGGDFTYYFPASTTDSFFGETFTTRLTVWELNFNGHYLFRDEDDLILYGLAGINITGIRVSTEDTIGFNDFDDFGETSTSDSEFGLNLGGGIEYSLDFADLFAEVKLGNLGGNANQFVLGAGIRYPLSF